MSRYFYAPYVSVAERKVKALKKIKALEKSGMTIEPLTPLKHRLKIADSFWGRAWCKHLESLSSYENRLPRGRTYVRNGSVLHLAIAEGEIQALVQGSELYSQTIRIDKLPSDKWTRIQTKCRGKIGSLIELLQGKISDEIMTIVTDPEDGLFPGPKEIHFNCSCPDSADLCKHLAAVLYGVGAKLDASPELLFKLRGVDHSALISAGDSISDLAKKSSSSRRRTLDATSIADVFGVDLDSTESSQPDPPPVPKSPVPKAKKKPVAKSAVKRASKKSKLKK